MSLLRRWKAIAVLVAAVAVAAAYGRQCVWRVEPGERLVVLRFGKVQRVVGAGMRLQWPAPIERAERVNTGLVRPMPIGFRVVDRIRGIPPTPEEQQWLSGDTNIILLEAMVEFQVDDPVQYLFEISESGKDQRRFLVRKFAESELSRRIGLSSVDELLGVAHGPLQKEIHGAVQQALDEYRTGLSVVSVQVLKANPPGAVKGAFDEVSSARADSARSMNEAEGDARERLAAARAQAHGLLSDAAQDRSRIVRSAEGEAHSFLAQAEQFRKAPRASQSRMWIEAVGALLSRAEVVVVSQEEGLTPRVHRLSPDLKGR